MNSYVLNTASSIIENIIEGVKEHIQIQQAKSRIPNHLGKQISEMIRLNNDIMVFDTPIYVPMHEQSVKDVPCIDKDTLMPKQLSKQSQNNDGNRSTFNLSFTTIGKKKQIKLSNRNSMALSSRGQSLVLTDKGNSKKKQLETKSPESRLQRLKEDIDQDDPEIKKHRVVYDAQLQHEFEYKKLILQHEKSFKKNLETISGFELQNPNNTITQDYDGQLMKSVFVEDKIKYYSARAGVGAQKKNFKDGNKTYIAPQPSVISRQRYSKQKDGGIEWKNVEMPLFPQGNTPQFRLDGFRSYQRKDYKKHFDRGYSRFDQLHSSIEVSHDKPDPTDSIFSERKHLNDSIELPTLGSSALRRSRVDRKIALPKLHGRYKVLDRYQQHR